MSNLERDKIRSIGEDIKSGSVDSILASLYQKVLFDLGINTTRFNHLMEKFLVDTRNSIPQNIREKSSARGNLRKELLKTVMTWKVFCKGLRFLHISKFKLIVQLHHVNGKITEHSKQVVIGDILDSDME